MAEAGLIANGSFETVPGTGPGYQGQGMLPTGWVSVNSTPDTYSNDGSYGLAPGVLGNFTGVTAFDGIRWVAGGAFGRSAGGPIGNAESFGTTLTATLAPGQAYQLDVHLHQALRADLNNPGAYDVYLASGNTPAGIAGADLLGTLAPTANTATWESRSLTFIAPVDSGARPFLFFAPYEASGNNSYPGLDATSLTPQGSSAVPEPASLTLASLAVIGLAGYGFANCARRRGSRESSRGQDVGQPADE
jgi:hypothetical protein